MPYMIISYVSLAHNQLKVHNQYLKMLKKKYHIKGEIKWNSVSRSKYLFYAAVLDYFFATDITFRAVIVDKSKIDETREQFTYSDFYFRMYYQLLHHKLTPDCVYNIYLDIKDTCSQDKLKTLSDILDRKNAIRNLQFIRSYESYMMQMADLIMGAINYHLRGMEKVSAKTDLIKIIESHTQINLTESTPKGADKFNLFFIDLK